MTSALEEARIEPSAVDYINARGTGTSLNDAAEARAIATLFGDTVPVVSTKGSTGHTLGAAGATEVAFTVVAVEQGWIPASLGGHPVDPDLAMVAHPRDNLDLADKPEPFGMRPDRRFEQVVMSGGSQLAVLVGKARRARAIHDHVVHGSGLE